MSNIRPEIHDAQSVSRVVEKYLSKYQPADYRLNVVRQGIRQDDDWWYVLIQPSNDNIRAFDYAGRLAEAEQDIQELEHLNILLVPVLPE